ncbi:MAG: hypothetical protein NT126_06215 [Bacteroidetes bacterium]|nr:hypothetical protein [Bacteroidota bacterium]
MTQKKQIKKPVPVSKKTAKTTVDHGILEKTDKWFEKNDKKLFYSLLGLSTLFSLLLFDSKVSTGGDDSGYIERAWVLLHEHTFPYFQGPGYPIFLTFFVKLFGLKVIPIKLSSVLCQFGFVWITYLTFRKRVPFTVLFSLVAFISFNSFIQYYSSQTYTEMFFLFVQSICLFITFKIIDSVQSDRGFVEDLKQNYLKWLLFGLMFVILSISKSIAFVTIGAILLFFLLNKNYKQIVFAIVAFAAFRVIYQLITTSAFGANDSDQLEMMLRKEIYKPESGHEDFSGMIDRFFNNMNTYFSLHIYRILNLRSSDTTKMFPALANLTAIILCIFTIINYRKNKYVFFSGLYMLALSAGIFFGVQATNTQDRLIIIVMPLIFVLLFFTTYSFAKKSDFIQYVFILFASLMMLITVGKSISKAQQNSTALQKNLSGDVYFGYTPDWVNFLKMSRYTADSLAADAEILSRKPEMSFIYGNGRKFKGQYMVTSMDPDTVLMDWKKQNIKYVILASLRRDPKRNDGNFINTLHRMMQPIQAKYPQKLKLLKTIGTDESAYLYEIDY